ncbi:MAG: AMP-binding protein, partial [Gammaproteobacteria bacterium]
MDPISQAFSEAYARLTAAGAPWELGEATVEGRRYKAFRNAPTSMREIFAPGRSHGGKEFLVYEGERWTYERLFALADALGNALHHGAGVAPGERVAIAMRNYPEWMAAFIAIGSIGAVAVPLNSWGRAEELEYGLRDSGARHVLCDTQRLTLLAGRREDVGLEAIVARHDGSALPARARSLEDVVAPWQGQALPEVPVTLDDPALMLYTSGTTGKPKGALSTQRALGQAVSCFECSAYAIAMANPETIAAMMQTGFEPTILLAYPLFHVSGLHASFLSALRGGRRIVMMYKW